MIKKDREKRVCKALDCSNVFYCLSSSKKKFCSCKCAAITNTMAIHSKEWRQKVSIANTKRKHTKETKEKISLAMTERRHSEYTRTKLSQSRKGCKYVKFIGQVRVVKEIRQCLRPECNNTFECSPKSNKKYCSLSCSSSWGGACKHEPNVTKVCASPECSNTFECSSYSKKKYCCSRCSLTHYPVERRNKVSKANAERLLKGFSNYSNYETGYFESVKFEKRFYYRSSFERKALELFESCVSIVALEYEKLSIPYYVGKAVRHYIPDYTLLLSNGERFVVEIKPSNFVKERRNVVKFNVACLYAKMKGMSFCVLSEKELFCENSVTTAVLYNSVWTGVSSRVTLMDTAAILRDGKIMIQSELYGDIEKQEETTCSPMIGEHECA